MNVSYGNDPEQIYDIYLPEDRSPDTKTMILVHGGGWTSGDKKDMAEFMKFLNEELSDIAMVNMNYRLANADHLPYPMQIDDITALVKALGDKQKEYQISKKIGFLGVSAGGHLALLWSYANDKEDQVNMVCSIVGPTNLADSAYVNSSDPVIQGLFNQIGIDIDFLKKVSPLYQADKSSPPTLLFYGGKDPLVPISQGSSLSKRLEELNVLHEYTLYPEGGHGWVVRICSTPRSN